MIREVFRQQLVSLRLLKWERWALGMSAGLTVMAVLHLTLIGLLPNRLVTTYYGEWSIGPESVLDVEGSSAICDAFELGGTLSVIVNGKWEASARYPNLFQTADGNSGIRFEMDPVGENAALLVAAPTAESFEVFPISRGDSEMLSVAYVIRNGTEVETLLESGAVAFESVVMNPACSRALVGVGYDSSRIWGADATLSLEAQHTATWGVPLDLQSSELRSFLRLVAVFFGFFTVLSLGFAVILGRQSGEQESNPPRTSPSQAATAEGPMLEDKGT